MSAMDLEEAGALWLSSKIDRRLKPRSIEADRGYLKHLKEFLGPQMLLKDMHAGSFLAYQTKRSKTAGVSAINHELNALAQMLRRAGLWEKIKYHYAPLREPDWQKPKTYTAQEEQRIFDFAKDDPNVELLEIVCKITRFTSASGSELRLLQIKNVLDLYGDNARIDISPDTTKNHIRPRTIPLEADALPAMQRAMQRAHKLGSHKPDHFVFPVRVTRNRWDPTRPASRSWLRKQYVALRKQTGIAHLRPHGFRHLIVTEMLENGTPPQTVKAVCGWVSEKMIETYSHTRLEAKKEAILSTVTAKKTVQPAETGGKLFLVSTGKNN